MCPYLPLKLLRDTWPLNRPPNRRHKVVLFPSATRKCVRLGRRGLMVQVPDSPHSTTAGGEVNWQHLAVWEPKCPSMHLLFPPHPVSLSSVLLSSGRGHPWHSHEDTRRTASCDWEVCAACRDGAGGEAPSCHCCAKGNVRRQFGILVPELSGPWGSQRQERRRKTTGRNKTRRLIKTVKETDGSTWSDHNQNQLYWPRTAQIQETWLWCLMFSWKPSKE